MSRSPLICHAQFFRLSLPITSGFFREVPEFADLVVPYCSFNGVVGFEKP